MFTPDDPALDPNERLARLERRQQRWSGIVILLILLAILEVAQRILPGTGEIFAHRIVLRTAGQPPRAEWSLWADGTPAFRLNDDRGKARALWALRRDGTLSLRMLDTLYTRRVELAVLPEGTPRLSLFGADGRSRASLWVDENDVPQLKTLDHAAK